MKQYLLNITKQILFSEPTGISKVRLAKLIYLVHKGLVQKELQKRTSLAFIRMPLGPVPDGFSSLNISHGIIIKKESIGLTYNRQTYLLNKPIDKPNQVVLKIVNNLKGTTTSELVEYTHLEPSWINNPNGSVYFIDTADINRKLPIKNWTSLNQEIDDQKLQGLLINGMINEIVDESTALEYPNVKSH